jgi:hypothetical protein
MFSNVERSGIMSEKNKVLMIFEDENGFEKKADEVEEIMKEFAEELKPVGLACKNWAKPN